MIAILTGVRLYVTVVLICISLMINDVELLSMYLLAFHLSSLEKCLFRSFAHLKNLYYYYFFLLWSCIISLYIWILNPCQIYGKQIFFHSLGYLFTLLMVSFAM